MLQAATPTITAVRKAATVAAMACQRSPAADGWTAINRNSQPMGGQTSIEKVHPLQLGGFCGGWAAIAPEPRTCVEIFAVSLMPGAYTEASLRTFALPHRRQFLMVTVFISFLSSFGS